MAFLFGWWPGPSMFIWMSFMHQASGCLTSLTCQCLQIWELYSLSGVFSGPWNAPWFTQKGGQWQWISMTFWTTYPWFYFYSTCSEQTSSQCAWKAGQNRDVESVRGCSPLAAVCWSWLLYCSGVPWLFDYMGWQIFIRSTNDREMACCV